MLDWGCGPALPSLALRRFRPDLELKAANFDMGIQMYSVLWAKQGFPWTRFGTRDCCPTRTIHWTSSSLRAFWNTSLTSSCRWPKSIGYCATKGC